MKAFAHSAHEERNESSRYELLVKLAAGGMGSVYVARGRGALGFENVVAVKRPHMHLLEAPEFREALIDEARIASKIRHANVVCVRDVAVEGALVYLVMDYVDGVSLAQLLRSDAERPTPPLPVGVATRIALDACA
ncbi:MAG TPA: protein kinase, partial [Labilithrix sp.]